MTIWGTRAEDWAEVMEGPSGWGLPVYERVIERAGIGEGTKVLDVGCGAGRFCRIAIDRGAEVAGLDATAEFIAIARERSPEAEFEVGDMMALPWPDDSFDVVTGFNSFFLAGDMPGALTEARRVAKPGGKVALTIFGREESCDSTELFAAIGRLVEGGSWRAADSDPDAPPPLHAEEVIGGIAGKAGLKPLEIEYLPYEERYPDTATMARGMLAAPPGQRAVAAAGAGAARDALAEAAAAADRVQPDGSVILREEVRISVARGGEHGCRAPAGTVSPAATATDALNRKGHSDSSSLGCGIRIRGRGVQQVQVLRRSAIGCRQRVGLLHQLEHAAAPAPVDQ